MTQQWISVNERLPEKPGKRGYEHVYCLVYAPSEGALVRPWNCEHLCWDDEDGDDYSSLNGHITHWMPLPDKPGSEPDSGPISSGTPCTFNVDNPDKVMPLQDAEPLETINALSDKLDKEDKTRRNPTAEQLGKRADC